MKKPIELADEPKQVRPLGRRGAALCVVLTEAPSDAWLSHLSSVDRHVEVNGRRLMVWPREGRPDATALVSWLEAAMSRANTALMSGNSPSASTPSTTSDGKD
jgi:hypothetical protein